jgi:hypothetical protein
MQVVFIGPVAFGSGYWIISRIDKGQFLQVFPAYLLHLLHFYTVDEALEQCRIQAEGLEKIIPIDQGWPDFVMINKEKRITRKEFLRMITKYTKNIAGFLELNG